MKKELLNMVRFFSKKSMVISIDGRGKTLFVRESADGHVGLVVNNKLLANAVDSVLNGIGQGVGPSWCTKVWTTTWAYHPKQVVRNVSNYVRFLRFRVTGEI